MHDPHADLILEFSSPPLPRRVFLRLAPLLDPLRDRLETHILQLRARARDGEDPAFTRSTRAR